MPIKIENANTVICFIIFPKNFFLKIIDLENNDLKNNDILCVQIGLQSTRSFNELHTLLDYLTS